tara:strand:- start:669 stop:1184 length:516 start_codon:yes stop_codon:yes gene_type:complete
MKAGKSKTLLTFLLIIFSQNIVADEKISTVPLINLEDLQPSYEEIDADETNNKEIIEDNEIKEKNKKTIKTSIASINIIGLDKITAKTTKINIKLGETKKFGLLQIKAIKCGRINSINEPGEAAYIQVKDLSDNSDEKVFVFNGWTFSSSPSLKPIDHPVYDIWLTGCENV